MREQLVRLSRPLLIADNKKRYRTVYGFLIQENIAPADPLKVRHYVGYLAGLHCVSNGDDYFTISYDRRGAPDWKDKRGRVHIKQDKWRNSIQEKCIKKLDLDYALFNLDMDEDDLDVIFVEDDGLIVNEYFYNELGYHLDERDDLC